MSCEARTIGERANGGRHTVKTKLGVLSLCRCDHDRMHRHRIVACKVIALTTSPVRVRPPASLALVLF
jgi:hypothetical protein